MGSEGGGCGGYSTEGPKTRTGDAELNQLGGQGSLYSLTLDEVQNQLGDLGKPLSRMNLDELLKTVLSADGSGNRQSSSSVTLNMDLSKKTVDEVWQDIQQGQKSNVLDRKATLGGMTLEDFLVKAGVVAGKKNLGSFLEGADSIGMSQEAQWMSFQQPVSVPGQRPIIDATYNPEYQVNVSSSLVMGALSDTQTPGRKRVAPDDIGEKSVERRQKRMIKNRESAARSRARKQAYTHELENKVSLLEEENERLKRQKELEKSLPSIPPPEPKGQLRRTSSAPL